MSKAITPNNREILATQSSITEEAEYLHSTNHALDVNISSTTGTTDTNLIEVGGISISLGQTTMASSLPIAIASNQSAIPASQSGTWNINNISGTVSLPTGAATETTLSALNSKIPSGLTVSATRLLVDGSGATQPISGTVTVVQPTAASLNATVVGTGTFATQAAQSGTWNIGTLASITNALPAGSNVIGHVITDSGSTTAVTGTVTTSESVPTTVLNGRKVVTTAGTRVTLASSTASKSVTIKALSTNTGIIYVGDASVSSTTGLQLLANETVSLDIANLSTVNLDSSINGEGVTYLAVV